MTKFRRRLLVPILQRARSARSARMAAILKSAVREVIVAWPSEHAVSAVVNRMHNAYGYKGLCALAYGLVLASIPPEYLAKRVPGERATLLYPPDHPDMATEFPQLVSVMQFVAAVAGDDVDMATALFRTHVATRPQPEAQEWMALLISTVCNTIYDIDYGCTHE